MKTKPLGVASTEPAPTESQRPNGQDVHLTIDEQTSGCKHENKTEVAGNPNRYHCDDCNEMIGAPAIHPPDCKHVTATTKQKPEAATAATVKSVRLTKDEHTRAKADAERKEKAERKKFVTDAEAAAKMVEKSYKQLLDLNEQNRSIYRKFAEVVEDMRPQLEIVRNFFAHRKQGDLLLGYSTGDEWSHAVLNTSYRHLCRCLNPPAEHPLLTDGDETSTPKPKPTAKSKLGSASYVNADHPDYARMQAAGLINDEATETTFVVSDA